MAEETIIEENKSYKFKIVIGQASSKETFRKWYIKEIKTNADTISELKTAFKEAIDTTEKIMIEKGYMSE